MASLATIETLATSLSAMLMVAVSVPGVVATVTSGSLVPVKDRITVSLSSNRESSITSMSMVVETSPARIVALPVNAVKSLPLPAVPVTM